MLYVVMNYIILITGQFITFWSVSKREETGRLFRIFAFLISNFLTSYQSQPYNRHTHPVTNHKYTQTVTG